jgi:hypothetical protein
MELDDIKSRIARRLEEPHRELDDEALLSVIRQKKDGALEKLRHQLLFECAMATAVVLALIFRGGIPLNNLPGKLTLALIAGLTVLQLAYFGYEYKRLGRIAHTVGNLKENLSYCLVRLETLVKLYRRLTLWSLPFGMALGIWIGLAKSEYQLFYHFDSLDLLIAAILSLFCVLGILAVRWGLNRYLERYYLRHLRALRDCLDELQEE